jgi:glutaredoxin
MVSWIRSIALVALIGASAAAQEFPTTPVNRPLKYEVVVLTFSQANCPYCRDAAPTWDLLRKDGVNVVSYDVEKDPQSFQAHKVENVPTTIVCAVPERSIFQREMLRVGGSRPLTEYRDMIKRAKERISAGIDPWPANLKEPWPLPK